MDLIAFVGNDKENWGQVTALINHGEWGGIVIIKNKEVAGFPIFNKASVVEVDSKKPLIELKKDILEKIRNKIKDFDVSVSIASGNGKEHMALISAILSIPSGIRLVAYTKNGVEIIN